MRQLSHPIETDVGPNIDICETPWVVVLGGIYLLYERQKIVVEVNPNSVHPRIVHYCTVSSNTDVLYAVLE